MELEGTTKGRLVVTLLLRMSTSIQSDFFFESSLIKPAMRSPNSPIKIPQSRLRLIVRPGLNSTGCG